MRYLILLLAISFTACNWGPWAKDNEKKDPDLADSIRAELVSRMSLYCDLSYPTYAASGTTEDNCDAALFTGLHGVACDYVEVDQFEDQTTPGKLCRRPGCTCYPGRSKSGFSKDMATGLQLHLSRRPNTDLVNRVISYGQDNDWVVCEAEDEATLLSRCVMSPKIVNRWFDLSDFQLVTDEEGKSADGLGTPTDFRGHLQVVGILTECQLYNGISDFSLKALKAQAEREPNNLLYQAAKARYAGGDATAIGRALLEKFPADRLPTSSDWCTEYLYQRDEKRNGEPNKDWLPCPEEGKTHPGTDFLLAAWTLIHE